MENRKKILLIDDEIDLLNLLETRLLAVGYSVVKADNGKDGIRLAKEERPDIIMLDIMMPGLGGGDVAAILKEDQDTKDIPIMFLTCLYTKKDEAMKGHTIKGNFFIAKPFDTAKLLAEIKNQLKIKKG